MSFILLLFWGFVFVGLRLSESGGNASYEKKRIETQTANQEREEFIQEYSSKAFDMLYERDRSEYKKQEREKVRLEIEQRLNGKCYEMWIDLLIYARYGLVSEYVAKCGFRDLKKTRKQYSFGELFDEQGYREEQYAALEFAKWYESEARAHGINDNLVYVLKSTSDTNWWGKDDPRAKNYVQNLIPDDIDFGRFIWQKTVRSAYTRDALKYRQKM